MFLSRRWQLEGTAPEPTQVANAHPASTSVNISPHYIFILVVVVGVLHVTAAALFPAAS